MANVTHPANVNGLEIMGLEDGTRYTIENTGEKPVLLIEAANKPASIDDEDGFWLAPRPYWPAPSRKIHQPGSRVIRKESDSFYVYGIKGDSTVVVAEAP